MVYITEAHPSDVWQMQSNIKDKVVLASPKDEAERALVAGACVRKLGIQIPAVIDEFGNSTEQAYTGWPDRLYLIDAHGHVASASRFLARTLTSLTTTVFAAAPSPATASAMRCFAHA